MPMTGIPAIVIFSLGSAVLAMVGFIAVRKLSKPINLDEHQTFLDAMCNIVGTLVSILLGLLVASALDTYQTLEATVEQEANAVADVMKLSRGLPDPLQGQVQTMAEHYCQQVVNIEWPNMAKGQASHAVFRTAVLLSDAIIRFRPANDGETNIQAAMLQSMETIGGCRRARILALNNTKSQILLPLLVICAVTVMLFTYLYVRHVSALQAILIGCVAVALGGNISLVYLLSRPFDGDWALKPRGFELNLKALREVYRSGMLAPAAGTYFDKKTKSLRLDPNYKPAQGSNLSPNVVPGAAQGTNGSPQTENDSTSTAGDGFKPESEAVDRPKDNGEAHQMASPAAKVRSGPWEQLQEQRAR